MPDTPYYYIGLALALFLGVGIHEYAHAKLADMAGDPTPGIYGRVTLNLTKHFEFLGTLMMLFSMLSGFGIGWGKPVPMDPRRMRNPRWDHLIAVIGGPISNLIQAIIASIIIRLLLALGFLTPETLDVLWPFVIVNVSLFLFNLLPIGPLDGMWVLGTFLPDKQRHIWTKFNLDVGRYLFLGLILLSQASSRMGQPSILWTVLGPPLDAIMRFLLGPNFTL
jgi:Zn-dependent protease